MKTRNQVVITFPTAAAATAGIDSEPGSTQTAFNVEAQGTGSFTGLAYTVSAHTIGKIQATIQVQALTSTDLDKLNETVLNLLETSKRQEVEDFSKTNVSADLSLWSHFFGGGANASYEDTRRNMESLGLTPEQISTIIDEMFELAKKVSDVRLDYTVDNTANDFSVSGDLQLYTISGTISTAQGTQQYRLLADRGTAGNGAAPVQGNVIPLS